MMLIPLSPLTSSDEITNSSPEKKTENPFKTYYSDPLKITALEIHPEANIAYIGCEYGLIIKNLTKEDFQVVAYFDGLDDSQIVDLELDKIHSRLFILVYRSSCVFVMDLKTLEIIERLQFDLTDTVFYGEKLLHICYDSDENRLFLGFEVGLAVLNLNSNEYKLYDAPTYFDIYSPDKSEIGAFSSFSIYDLEYNPKASELYIATSIGLSIFNVESKKFTHYRDESMLAGYVYDVMYVENLNKLFLAMDTVVEFDLEIKDAIEYPKIIAEGYNFSVFSLAYDSHHNLIYAFYFEHYWNYFHFLVFDPLTRKSVREIWVDQRMDPYGPSLPHLIYDNIHGKLYAGVGRITSETSDGTSPALTGILFSYNSYTNISTPINVTNHVDLAEKIPDLKVIPTSGNLLIIDRNHDLLLFDKNGDFIKEYKTWKSRIWNVEIFNNSIYLLGWKQLKTLNLSSGETQNLTSFNYSYSPLLEIGRITGKFYIGTEYGLIVFDEKTNVTKIYPLSFDVYESCNPLGLAVDEIEEVVYLTRWKEYYKLQFKNENFELMENTSDYSDVGIHYNSNIVIINNKYPEKGKNDLGLEGFPKSGTISSIHIDQVSNKLYAITGPHWQHGGSIGTGFHSPEDSYRYTEFASGLIIYDLINKTYVNYSVDHGLPSNMLSGVAYDPKNKLIHITGDRFYTVVNESELSNGFLKKNVTKSKFSSEEPKNTAENGYLVTIIYTIISGVSLITIILFVLFIEPSKYKLLVAFAAPLYTRLKKNKILEHETRGQILGFIQSEPGTYYSELKKNLELNNGALSYHLHVLEREGDIKSLNKGIHKYFFPGNFKLPNKFFKMNEVQKLIFKKLNEHPGLSQKNITKELGSSTSTVNYNIKILEEKGIVKFNRRGNETQCFIIQNEK
jgi:predicted transcriptional regulator